MSEQDPYRDWLEEFNREVDEALQESGPEASARAPIARAMTDFESWWRHNDADIEREPEPGLESVQINKELDFARREVQLLRGELERLRGKEGEAVSEASADRIRELSEEKAHLLEKLRRFEHDNEELRRHDAAIQGQIADLRVKTSKVRDDYENQIRRLEDKVRAFNEQVRTVSEAKRFLESEYAKQSERLAEFEGGIKDAYEAKSRSENENRELQARIEDLEARLRGDAERHAELNGALSELRNQAGTLQEKLVRSRESVDAQLAETRAATMDAAKQSEAAERRLLDQQREAEERIRETARYLELKLREMQSENKDRLSEFREVLDTLSRMRALRSGEAR
jgi:chromosome segregation ATPase